MSGSLLTGLSSEAINLYGSLGAGPFLVFVNPQNDRPMRVSETLTFSGFTHIPKTSLYMATTLEV